MKSQLKRSDPWPVAHLRRVAMWIRHARLLDIESVAWAPTFSIDPGHRYAIDYMRLHAPKTAALWDEVVEAGHYPVINGDYIYLDRESAISGDGDRWFEPMDFVSSRRILMKDRRPKNY